MESFLEDRADDEQLVTPLPLGQRLLYSALLPNLAVYASAILHWSSSYPKDDGPGAAGIGGAFMMVLLAAIAFAVFLIPITICTVLAAHRPWRHWYTALAGGVAGGAAGLLIGGPVILILKLATD